MNAALERLRERNRADVKLEDGLLVTIEPPPVRDHLIAGGMSYPLLQKLASLEGSDKSILEELTPEEFTRFQTYQKTLVAFSIVAIEGDETDLPMSPEDTSVFTQPQFDELWAYASREKPLPGKDG